MSSWIIVDDAASKPLYAPHVSVIDLKAPWTYNKEAARKFSSEKAAGDWLARFVEATGIQSPGDKIVPWDTKAAKTEKKDILEVAPSAMTFLEAKVEEVPTKKPPARKKPQVQAAPKDPLSKRVR